MKDALTYANDAGFFSFNVVGWKAEFERLIEAVRADAIADHIRDATKNVGQIGKANEMVEENSEVCNWRQPTYSDAECNAWQADCDQYWAITEGTPIENGMKFCHGCGKPIKEHSFVDTEDEE